MVFSSVTPLDHHNWHQQLQQSNPQGNYGGGENVNFQSPLAPPQHGGAGGEGSIRPGSMVDRARLAKLPMPEPGLNCPRCDSTNTKFCYFNNYSLTQPRHFCKACRRYWTRGGALRNVPVGGGCRRNKRINKNRRQRSKSPTQNAKSINNSGSPSRCSNENIAKTTPSLQFPFMSSYGGVSSNINTSNLGVIFPPQNEMGNFQLGSGNNFSNILSIGSGDQSWRLPFLAGFEVPNNTTNLYHDYNRSEGGAVEAAATASSMVDQADFPLKVEENKGLNLSRKVVGISENTNNQQQAWQVVGNNWAGGFSSVNSTSSSNPTTNFI